MVLVLVSILELAAIGYMLGTPSLDARDPGRW
jgi:hypothetical protein